jgi:hypothetical protein
MIFVDHPSSCPNRPVSIPRDSLLGGAHEMKTVDGFTDMALLVGVWPLSAERASPGEFGFT